MDSKQTSSLWTLLRPSVRLIIVSWSTSSTSTASKGKSADGSLTSWITEGRQRWSAVPVPHLSASCLVYHKGASGWDPACSSFTSMTFLTPRQPKLVSLRMTAAYKVVTCPDDQTQLQRDLNQLAEWEKWWDMAFHPGKCTSLPVTRSRKPLGHQYELHGQRLSTLPSAWVLPSVGTWTGASTSTTCAQKPTRP